MPRACTLGGKVNERFVSRLLAWCEATLQSALAAEANDGQPAEAQQRAAESIEELAGTEGIPYFDLARRFRLQNADSAILSLCLGCAAGARVARLMEQVGGRRTLTPEAVRHLLADGSHERSFELVRPLARGDSLLVARRILQWVDDADGTFHGASIELTRAARDYLLDLEPSRLPYYRVIALSDRDALLGARRATRDALVELVADYHRALAEHPDAFSSDPATGPANAIHLHGPAGCGVRPLAEAVARAGHSHAVVLDGRTLATQRFGELIREAFDVAVIRRAAVIVDAFEQLDRGQVAAVMSLLEPYGPFVALCDRSDPDGDVVARVLTTVAVEPPDEEARAELWRAHLPPQIEVDADVDFRYLGQIYPHDDLTTAAAARLLAVRSLAAAPPRASLGDLTAAAEAFVPTTLGTLARASPVRGSMADIILPPDDRRVLERIIAAGGSFERALSEWGLGRRFAYGKCLTALFTGEPGTGKTHAAKIIASELGKKLFVINVDRIVSKWAGETEKNIHEVFSSVGGLGGILLFDEADSLFSKRVEVASSQDKWANMLTNVLLTEIEEFEGIVLLTSNKPKSIDKAFERRILYTLTFELPDEAHRQQIWEHVAAGQAPLADDVDFGVMARRFELSGGEIKNAFLRAAFEAHHRRAAIDMDQLARSCREEYAKKGKVVHGA
jgi:SpoVK/Ycf46/Vps4 family AAA+-type ATPase